MRIPAALCGLAGFKPTQHRIPRDGVVPLSTTLDSIGPLANSIACCAIADAVMAGEPAELPPAMPVDGLRLAGTALACVRGTRARGRGAFERPARRCRVPARASPTGRSRESTRFPTINAAGGFAPIEAYAWHRELIARRGSEYDPRVRGRIERAAE